MSQQEDPLALEVGGQSLAANLERAIERGDIVRHPDGRLGLRDNRAGPDEVGRKGGFIQKAGTTRRNCMFLNDFMFDHVYAQAAVPFGCQNCFKIKVATDSLRAMMAVKAIAEATEHTTKSGSDVDNPANQHLYSTYLYFDGLDSARQAHGGLRDSIDRHEHLGPGVSMTIKRGCTNYERKCGPSDQYRFDPRQEAVEAALLARFVKDPPPKTMSREMVNALRLMRWVEIAYRIGDDTYKDFTDGRPLRPPLVSYSPEGEGEPEA
jgi:hypothetical protein